MQEIIYTISDNKQAFLAEIPIQGMSRSITRQFMKTIGIRRKKGALNQSALSGIAYCLSNSARLAAIISSVTV